MEIAGRTVLITGASSGIGAACADAFAGAGCRLLLVARRRRRLDALTASLRERYQVDVAVETVDVRDRLGGPSCAPKGSP